MRPARLLSTGRSTSPHGPGAPLARNFIQNDPREGEPATYDTEVRVLYDDDALYFGVFASDDEPADIIVSDLKKDFNTGNSDGFLIILDTFHDERNGYQFATNPAGAKWDAQMSNEGRENNANWDGIWDVVDAHRRDRLVRGDPDSVPDAASSAADATADVGHQLRAQAAPAERGQLLVAAAAHLRPSACVAGRHARRDARRAPGQEPAREAVRARQLPTRSRTAIPTAISTAAST